MSVHQLRSHRAKRPPAKASKKKEKVRGQSVGLGRDLGPSFAPLLEDRCLTFREWCQLNGIGPRTGRRIIDGPNPPAITRLSERRIGITVRANREWQASRTR